MSQELLRFFVIEARELVDWLGVGLRELERGGALGPVRERLFRHAHTLKGAARIVGQEAIARAAHAFEDQLAAIVPESAAPAAALDELRALVAACDRALGALERPAGEAAGAVPDEGATSSVRVPLQTLDALLATLDEVKFALERLHEPLEGALTAAAPSRDLRQALDVAARELAGARDLVDRCRMLPASTIFTALELVAHDAAAGSARRVSFEATGGEIALESQILAQLRDALSHVVRNAVDHGIEAADARVAAGKPGAGQIRLEVQRHGHRARFICRDDGRGIDAEGVVRRAVERGLLAPGGDPARAAEAAHRLIFEAGVTTRDVISALSGRGVGLDVVRTVAERLGGFATVESEPGRGTTLTIEVPTSRTAGEALLADAGGVPVAFPLDAVVRVIGPGGAERTRTADGEVVHDAGLTLPYFPLAVAFGAEAPEAPTIVVVRAGQDLSAIGVSRLGGIASLAAVPLPPLAGSQPLVSGATIDATGAPRPVLDPRGLADSARSPRRVAAPTPAAQRPAVLAIDDSLTTRMLVQRLLEAAGYEVRLATGVEEGLALARKEPFELFVVDGEMPGLDGFAFLERVRADARLRGTPALMLTSLEGEAHRRRSLAAGARAHLIKGEFAQEAFLAMVRELVGR